MEAELRLSWREDGGLRIYSPTHPGMVLSHSRPDLVILDVLPVLAVLGFTPPRDTDRNPKGEKPKALSAKHESRGRRHRPTRAPQST